MHWQYLSRVVPLLPPEAPTVPDWVSTSFPDRLPPRAIAVSSSSVWPTPFVLVTQITAWAVYPDRLPHRRAHAPAHAVLDPLARPAAPALAVSVYPDWLVARRAPPVPLFDYDPLPRPDGQQLRTWTSYPDRVPRATLPVALMPAFMLGPLIPIPNERIPIEDRILIGQNQSIETPAYPSIGGSSTWS